MAKKRKRIKRVEFFPAGEFVCNQCGRNSYFSMLTLEGLTEDQEECVAAIKSVMGEDEVEMVGNNIILPDTVKCQYPDCGELYRPS